jgi:para-aminobenzoate synthetase component 1
VWMIASPTDCPAAAADADMGPEVEELTPAPDSAALLRRLAGLPGLLFLDSARFHPLLGRFSYLAADPFASLRADARGVRVEGVEHVPRIGVVADPLAAVAAILQRWPAVSVPGLPPFQGGAAGLFSYDLCHHLERVPRARSCVALPDLALFFYDWVVAFDHLERRAWIISTGLPATEPGARRARARERLGKVKGWLGSGSVGLAPPSVPSQMPGWGFGALWPVDGPPGLVSTFSRAAYLRAIERAIDYIHAGDVYQVNLAQTLVYPLREPPVALYLRLRARNPAPFAGYLDGGDFVIASASPERFLRVECGEVETRPIKGTRPRWPQPEADMYAGGELVESAKDRAENVMIVDLLRNDLGRVCAYGSVRVVEPCRLESYEFVHHLVSEVRGRLRPGLGPLDLVRAAFPGGSVTGAPKIRAMEIIAELEPWARGSYCGSLGFIGFDGAMDTSILIRTFTCAGGWIQFPVGGGIVAESVPEREYEETLHKAEGMLRALA